MSEKTASMGITPDQLKEILSTVIAEIRKPPEKTPEQIAAEEQEKEMRRQQGELELQIQAQRRAAQRQCNHKHQNGSSAVASVNNGEFLICNHCQAKIKNAKGPFDEESQGFIYDERMYWDLVQTMSQTTF